jgi:SprT protein
MNTTYTDKTVVSKELQLRVESVVLDCLVKAQTKYGTKNIQVIPEIRYNTKGKVAGWAHSSRTKPYIDINPILLNENVEEVINQTVPHEMAHIVANMVYCVNYVYNIKPHGREWASVMNTFGVPAERCHNMDVSTIVSKRNKGKEFQYTCNCQDRIHKLSELKHRRFHLEGYAYQCRYCKKTLTFLNVNVVDSQ